MAQKNIPTTMTRMFDPTFWGLRKNQIVVFLCALAITAMGFFIKGAFFPDSGLAYLVVGGISALGWLFFIFVGLDRAALYGFEKHLSFWIRYKAGDEIIEKYNEKDEEKVKNVTHIKKIYNNGFVEFVPQSKVSNNWAVYFKLDCHSPEDLESFFINAERLISSVPDGTELVTVLKARKNNENYAETFEREIRKERQIPLLREICYEQAEICRSANTCSYETHLGILIPYETNRDRAFKTLGDLSAALHNDLKTMTIPNEILNSPDKIYEMFDGMITYNIHVGRRHPL